MNQYILIAMDHENRSKEELKKNLDAAYDAVVAVKAAHAAADAAFVAAYAVYAAFVANDEYFVNEYFEVTGENREDYEKALKEMKK